MNQQMRLKAKLKSEGFTNNQIVLSVETTDGEEELIVDKSLYHNGYIDVDYVKENKTCYLVRFPVESFSGSPSAYVRKDQIANLPTI